MYMRAPVVLAMILLSARTVSAQPPCTSGPPSASDNCPTATPIGLNGVYCDNTCNFTANNASWFGSSGVFCGSGVNAQTIENNGFYRFQATASSVSLTFCVAPGCTQRNSWIGASGIQVLVFNFPTPTGLGTCGSGSINGYYCLKQLSGMDCGSCGLPKGCRTTTVSGLTSGKHYYIMIDGFEGDCCGFTIQATTNITLPVELISFTGEATRMGNDLRWQTASERNNSHFDIERSVDAAQWERIGTRPGAGNSVTLNSYEHRDPAPPARWTYYRLKQVDLDGSHTYSDVIALERTGASDLLIAPNPTAGTIRISFTAPLDGPCSITVRSVTELVHEQWITIEEGFVSAAVELPQQLADGLYLLTITDANGRTIGTGKVVKQSAPSGFITR